jgi:hypothetical protein
MSTLLARSADILVTMDDERRELPDAGLFVRDGISSRSASPRSFRVTPTSC